ncbi:MAG: pilus assembly protein [Firmicutes bacterium]|nr:pilus assembly protein [Bacillota bacterium]
MPARTQAARTTAARGKQLRGDSSGQALVELALVLPLFLLIIVGILDFGQLFMTELTLQEAARDGARYASVGQNDAEIAQDVLADAVVLNTTAVSVSVNPPDGERVSGDPVTVTVTYPFTFLPPLSAFLPNGLTLQAQTTMRME